MRSRTTILIAAITIVACRRSHAPQVIADDATPIETHAAHRCPELVITPYSNPDFPSPFNSDHTPKRLPPPPPNVPGAAMVFQYDDFGPQVMAAKLIGMAWWSWEGGGSFEPGDSFDVRVVVFHGRTQEEIARRYPTIEGKSDYRLVERDAALKYLDEAIAEMKSGDDDVDFTSEIRRLEKTRAAIVECLPSAGALGAHPR